MASYIPDGFSRTDGYVAAASPDDKGELLYDALEFSYRPATRLDTVKLDAEIAIAMKARDFDPMAAVKAENIACKFVADRLIAWNLTYRDTSTSELKPVAVSVESVGRMQQYLFGQLYNIVRGNATSDAKPGETPAPTNAEQLKN